MADTARPTPPAARPGRRTTRRHGRVLERAIYDAVLAEMAEHGFDRLTLEGVARRAGTGKAALYRRWPAKLDMVVETFQQTLPGPDSVPATADLRGDLLGCLRQMAQVMAGPVGAALRRSLSYGHQHPELADAVRQRVIEPRQRALWMILAAGAERGEVRPEALAPECVYAGPAIILQQFLATGCETIPDETITRIVDNVVLPMIRPCPP